LSCTELVVNFYVIFNEVSKTFSVTLPFSGN
jgi:hypothetical protein